MKNNDSASKSSSNPSSDGVGSSAEGGQPLQCIADQKRKKRMYHIQSRYLLPTSSTKKENAALTRDADGKSSTPIGKKSLFVRGPSLTPSHRHKLHPKRLESPATSTPALLQMSMISVPSNVSCIADRSFAQQVHRTTAAPLVPCVDTTMKNLKLKKPKVPVGGKGPMLVLPSSSSSAADGASPLNNSEEAHLMYSRYIAAKFLHLKSKESLEKLCSDGRDKVWRTSLVNKDLCEKKTALEVELNSVRHNRLFREHLLKQKEILEGLSGDLPRFVERFSEVSTSLDACLHYLPLRNFCVPQGPEELEELMATVDKLNVAVDSVLSSISPSTDKLSDLAESLSTNKTIATRQVENIKRYKKVLVELKKISTHDTFLTMKRLQQETNESDHALFGCDS